MCVSMQCFCLADSNKDWIQIKYWTCFSSIQTTGNVDNVCNFSTPRHSDVAISKLFKYCLVSVNKPDNSLCLTQLSIIFSPNEAYLILNTLLVGVNATRSLVILSMFCRPSFEIVPLFFFSFGHSVVSPSLTCGFW